jgi:hypothetical protein
LLAAILCYCCCCRWLPFLPLLPCCCLCLHVHAQGSQQLPQALQLPLLLLGGTVITNAKVELQQI